jgi:hypothetical protein
MYTLLYKKTALDFAKNSVKEVKILLKFTGYSQ